MTKKLWKKYINDENRKHKRKNTFKKERPIPEHQEQQ